MMNCLSIKGNFATLNTFIDANRRSNGRWNNGNTMKQKDQKRLVREIKKAALKKCSHPIYIRYTFFEANRKRDLDNVSGYFHKIFQDALIDAGIIPNDNWRWVKGFSDEFRLDRNNPRIEVVIIELKGST